MQPYTPTLSDGVPQSAVQAAAAGSATDSASVGLLVKGTTVGLVVPGGSAWRTGGVEVGDVVQAIDDTPVTAATVVNMMRTGPVGSIVKITLFRPRTSESLEVNIKRLSMAGASPVKSGAPARKTEHKPFQAQSQTQSQTAAAPGPTETQAVAQAHGMTSENDLVRNVMQDISRRALQTNSAHDAPVTSMSDNDGRQTLTISGSGSNRVDAPSIDNDTAGGGVKGAGAIENAVGTPIGEWMRAPPTKSFPINAPAAMPNPAPLPPQPRSQSSNQSNVSSQRAHTQAHTPTHTQISQDFSDGHNQGPSKGISNPNDASQRPDVSLLSALNVMNASLSCGGTVSDETHIPTTRNHSGPSFTSASNANHEIHRAQEQAAFHEQRAKQATAEAASLADTVKGLLAAVEKSRSEVDSSRRSSASLTNRVEALETELRNRDARLSAMSASHSNEAATAKWLQTEVTALRQQQAALEHRAAHAEAELQMRLRGSLTLTQVDAGDLERANMRAATAEAECAALSSEVTALKELNWTVSQQIQSAADAADQDILQARMKQAQAQSRADELQARVQDANARGLADDFQSTALSQQLGEANHSLRDARDEVERLQQRNWELQLASEESKQSAKRGAQLAQALEEALANVSRVEAQSEAQALHHKEQLETALSRERVARAEAESARAEATNAQNRARQSETDALRAAEVHAVREQHLESELSDLRADLNVSKELLEASSAHSRRLVADADEATLGASDSIQAMAAELRTARIGETSAYQKVEQLEVQLRETMQSAEEMGRDALGRLAHFQAAAVEGDATVAKLREELTSLSQQLSEVAEREQNMRLQLEQHGGDASATIAKLTATVQTGEQQYKEACAEVDRARQAFEAMKIRADGAERELQSRIGIGESELQALRERLSASDREVQHRTAEVASLKEELESVQKTMTTLRTNLASSLGDVGGLQKQIDDMKVSEEGLRVKLKAAQSEAAEGKARSDGESTARLTLQAAMDTLTETNKREIATLRSKLEQTESELRVAAADVSASRSDAATARATADTVDGLLDKERAINAELAESERVLKKKLAEATGAAQSKSETETTLRAKLDAAVAELHRTKDDAAEAAARAASDNEEVKRGMSALEDEVTGLLSSRDNSANLARECKQLREKQVEAQAHVKTLSDSLLQLQGKLKEETDRRQAAEAVVAVARERQKRGDDTTHAERMNSVVEQLRAELDIERLKSARLRDQLQREHGGGSQRGDSQRGSVNAASQDIASLEGDLIELRATLDAERRRRDEAEQRAAQAWNEKKRAEEASIQSNDAADDLWKQLEAERSNHRSALQQLANDSTNTSTSAMSLVEQLRQELEVERAQRQAAEMAATRVGSVSNAAHELRQEMSSLQHDHDDKVRALQEQLAAVETRLTVETGKRLAAEQATASRAQFDQVRRESAEETAHKALTELDDAKDLVAHMRQELHSLSTAQHHLQASGSMDAGDAIDHVQVDKGTS